jgi:hypothetical protein
MELDEVFGTDGKDWFETEDDYESNRHPDRNHAIIFVDEIPHKIEVKEFFVNESTTLTKHQLPFTHPGTEIHFTVYEQDDMRALFENRFDVIYDTFMFGGCICIEVNRSIDFGSGKRETKIRAIANHQIFTNYNGAVNPRLH